MGSSGANQPRLGQRDRLLRFQLRAAELVAHEYVTSGSINTKMHVSFTADTLHVEVDEPNVHLLTSFLLPLRRFMAPSEPISVQKTRSLIRDVGTGSRLESDMELVEEIWQYALDGSGLRMMFDGVPLLPNDAWELYVNGVYFHDDVDKRELLDRLDVWDLSHYRYSFLSGLVGRVEYVENLAEVIRRGFESDAFRFTDEG